MVKQSVSKKKSLKSMSPKQYLKLTLVVALIGFVFASATSVASYPSEAHRNVVKERSQIINKQISLDYNSDKYDEQYEELQKQLDKVNETPESKYTANVQLFLGLLGSVVFSFIVIGVTYFYIRRHTSQRKLVTVAINATVNLVASLLASLPWFVVDWMLQGKPNLLANFGAVDDGTAAATVVGLLVFLTPIIALITFAFFFVASLVFAGYEWYKDGANKSTKKRA